LGLVLFCGDIISLVGGYDGEFYNGMRTGIVWQKFISQAEKSRNDIVLSDILLDDNLSQIRKYPNPHPQICLRRAITK
jgi:hypothetical protein